MSGLFRRQTSLPKKTRGIYVSPGNTIYFLDVADKEVIDKEKLSFLFKNIWVKKKLSVLDIGEIYNFLCNIAAKNSIFIFDQNERIFSKPKYDEDLKNALYLSI